MKRVSTMILIAAWCASCESGGVTGPTTPALTPAPPLVIPEPAGRPPNQAPAIVVRISPDPATGAAPFHVQANLCRSSDPDHNRLTYEFKWGGLVRYVTESCQSGHTYQTPGRFRAIFCVHDDQTETCSNALIDVL